MDNEIAMPRETGKTTGRESAGRKMFIGPNGLRAGWRLLIFMLMVVAMSAVARMIVAKFFNHLDINPAKMTPTIIIVPDALFCVLVSVSAWVMSKIEGRRFGEYGLPLKRAFRKELWLGAFMGLLATSGTILAILALGGAKMSGPAIHGANILTSAAAWGLAFLLSALAEEFLFRGYAQFTLTTGMGFWPAALLLSGLFGLVHMDNKGETVLGALSVVSFGLILCLFLRRTGNLWCAVGFHLGYDWGQTFLYGVPNSGLQPTQNFLSSVLSGPRWLTGGSVGPEASIFCPIVLAIVAILFSLKYREARYRPVAS